MNIDQQEAGRSSELGDGNVALAARYGLVVYMYQELDVLRPDVMGGLWRAYQAGGDGGYDQAEFERRTRRGWLMHFGVAEHDADRLQGAIGLEFLIDARGALVNIVYLTIARDGSLKRCEPALRDLLWHTAKSWSRMGDGPARVLLRGRPGWRRWLKSRAIEIDAEGIITEDQERFRHGVQ